MRGENISLKQKQGEPPRSYERRRRTKPAQGDEKKESRGAEKGDASERKNTVGGEENKKPGS